ncbi:sucrose-phosphate phosphatase [Nostoc sp. CENA67]|uniref:sucrose-phosphate phosphatase n=1 Tax=Amazonocrinis nigriterrae CENA67 TaxID=2794033 RepID=A0A8J7LAQ7_9NOST|nr:sucrose-phosphate phosphatase [Amazonocrinis nigriterrae]MBH8562926.1 sucrose-phosphate phosphatase [Amazonocrinis nigriterrae CENA67]
MKHFLFVSDLDHTLVGEGDEALKGLYELNQELERHRQEYGTKIVYATGRSLTLYKQLALEKSLLEPDALITSVGTEVYLDQYYDAPDSQWSTKLSDGWNRELIADFIDANFPNELIPQQESEQRPFKVSYLIKEEAAKEILDELKFLLEKQNLKFKITHSSSASTKQNSLDVDILPLNADKGLAVKYIQQRWGFSAEKTVVCGDSGNDISLFSVGEERGILVGNARPELLAWYDNNKTEYRYYARGRAANGIIEGLRHFQFISVN